MFSKKRKLVSRNNDLVRSLSRNNEITRKSFHVPNGGPETGVRPLYPYIIMCSQCLVYGP